MYLPHLTKKEMYKVIFLDIDGVLNVYPQGHDEYGPIFHQHFIDNLGYIIEQTGAKLVISSTWRGSGIEYLRNLWKHRNMPGDIIDITPNCVDVVNSGRCEFYDTVDRGHEIQQWLDENEVLNYCIIDDDNDMLETQRNNFVRTANNEDHDDCIDIGYGLTKICSGEVIQILNS